MISERDSAEMDGLRTPGEKLVAAYLDGRELPYSYETFVTGANPDFVACHPVAGQVVLEVYEPSYLLPRSPDGALRAGFIPSQDKMIQRGITSARKSRQAAAARDRGLPFVLVIADTNSEVALTAEVIPGALFGTLQFGWNADPEADPADDSTGLSFGSGGRLQPELNTRFSAVALISRSARRPVAGQIARPDEAHPLHIFHNPYAGISLAPEFAGPHDEQWTSAGAGRTYEGIE
jgi:hypothetical protein